MIWPDPLWSADTLSGALFLYFDQPLVAPVRASASIALCGAGPGKLVELVARRSPSWETSFRSMYGLYAAGAKSAAQAADILKPLMGKQLLTAVLAYPHTTEWMDRARTLLDSTGMSTSEILSTVHPFSAADSLAKHVLYEKYLELIHPATDGFTFGKERASRLDSYDPIPIDFDIDPLPLYNYCETLFSATAIEDLLAQAFALRLLFLKECGTFGGIFLSQTGVLDLLKRLPLDQNKIHAGPVDEDVISWEIFRQLLSPVLDPLTKESVDLLLKFKSDRPDEVRRLKTKCMSLSTKMADTPTLETVQSEIQRFIEIEVRDDLSALLQIDKRTVEELLVTILSDKKAWASTAALIASSVADQDLLKAGSAIAAMVTLGAEAVRAAATRRKDLKASPYTLIYNMKRSSQK
jgi:hypothetical protein